MNLVYLLPPCFPDQNAQRGQKNLMSENIVCLGEIGAGEANRTPDPNLGKVMLYP
jgi:hypothetical protein